MLLGSLTPVNDGDGATTGHRVDMARVPTAHHPS
jgi:hypothetical protein